VAPAVERGEDAFDAGAKYHVPGNTPYTRYFLADILQFQFHRALCQTAGHQGPIAECSIYNNKEAGAKFWAMLQKGQSQPWPATLKELTGSEQMDAGAILDYFAPLSEWLTKENEGQTCGWQG
jgi:peptidyl-dipeptidase A